MLKKSVSGKGMAFCLVVLLLSSSTISMGGNAEQINGENDSSTMKINLLNNKPKLSLEQLNGTNQSISESNDITNFIKYTPDVLKSSPPPDKPLAWANIKTEGFEGAWPNAWNVYDQNPTNGNDYWGDNSAYSRTGFWSGFSSDEGGFSPGYDNYMDAWMVYGPFDLSDANDAELLFYHKTNTELNFDYFKWMASPNGINFYGYQISGNYWSTWNYINFDLTSVPTIGNLLGDSTVWIAFIFESDLSINGANGYDGAYLDDITLRKNVVPNSSPLVPSLSSPIDSSWINDITPFLDWSSFQHGGDGNTQSGFEVRVRDYDGGDVIVYDTGFVPSTASSHTYSPGSYSGWDAIAGYERYSQNLQYGRHYHWHARFRDSSGDWGPWGGDNTPDPPWDFYTGDNWDATTTYYASGDDGTSTRGTWLTPTTSSQSNGIHYLGASDQYDWYRINMISGRQYHFDTIGGTGDNIADLYSDQFGIFWVAGDDDSGGGLQFSFDYVAGGTQTYYLRVKAFTAGNSCSYTLHYWYQSTDVSVYGTLRYYNDNSGIAQPIKYASIDLYKEPNTWIANTNTIANGDFTFGTRTDLWGANVYIIIRAETNAVKVKSNIQDPWSFETNHIIATSNNIDFSRTLTDSNEKAVFNIYHRILDGYQYTANYPSTNTPPQVTVLWFSNNADGTHYHPGGEIHILGGADPDEWDDGVILHEYGHFIAWTTWTTKSLRFANSPGGAHSWEDTFSDFSSRSIADGGPLSFDESERLAWSEGWGHYKSSIVRNSPSYTDINNSGYTHEWNLENGVWRWGPGSGIWDGSVSANDYGSTNEAAIAGVLWDIYDSTNDDQTIPIDGIGDTLTIPNSQNRIWDVLQSYSTSGHGVYTINEFWDGWLDRSIQTSQPTFRSQINAIYWEHGINKNDRPTSEILSPNGGGSYSGVITVSATNVNDIHSYWYGTEADGTVSKVKFEFSLDGSTWYLIGEDTSSAGGWNINWNTNAPIQDGGGVGLNGGDSTVWVRSRAYDGMEWQLISDVSDSSFGVDNGVPSSYVENISPYWRTTTPISITAIASDSGGSGLASVQLWYRYSSNNVSWGGWNSVGLDTSFPWSWTFNTPNGPGYYEFYTVARDNALNVESTPGTADTKCGYDPNSPTILSTIPTNGATGVAITQIINVVYNERMDTSVTPILMQTGGANPGGWIFLGWTTTNVASDTARWSHNNWAYSAGITMQVSGGKDLAGNTLASPYSWSFTIMPEPASATADGPTSGLTNVGTITITYTWAGTPTSINIYYTTNGGTTWTFLGNDVTVNGYYAIVLTTSGTYGWIAQAVGGGTTEPSPPTAGTPPESASYIFDNIQPEITNTVPADAVANVAINQDIVITFSEPMNTGSVAYTVNPNPGGLSELWSGGNTILTISHTNFVYGVSYTVTMTAGSDVAGNTLQAGAAPNPWTFTAIPAASATASGPTGGPTNVAGITITYIWTGTPTSVNIYYTTNGGSGWTLAGNDATVDGNFAWAVPSSGTYGWITQAVGGGTTESSPPTGGTTPEATPYTFENVRPTVISTTPSNTATDVMHNQDITIVFSETINTATFTYTIVPNPGGLSIVWSVSDTTVTISHADFGPNTRYWVNITVALDLAGNSLNPTPHPFYFNTAAGATASASGPISGPTNTADITITYTWTETPTSVNIFYTLNGGTTWNLLGNDATVDGNYDHTLSTSGTYDWIAQAVGGGSIEANPPSGGTTPECMSYVFDNVRPNVILTNPANIATGVVLNQVITIIFNEAVNTSSFMYTIVPNPGGISLTWSNGNTMATISHTDFAASSMYWVNITVAEDLAGNVLNPTPYSFSFTTSTTLGAIASATGPIGGPTNLASIEIVYTWTGSPTYVWLYYTINGGANWTFAGNDTTIDGIYAWTLPVDGTYGWIAQAWGDNSPEMKPPFNGTLPEVGDYIYDTAPPIVWNTTPIDNATEVNVVAGTYIIRFSEAMNTSILPAGNITTNLPGVVWVWSANGMWLNGTYSALLTNTIYYVNLTGSFTDLAGNALIGDLEWIFTTRPPPPPDTTAPTSSVSVLSQYQITLTFQISYTSSDNVGGSGIKTIELWFKKDNGAWTLYDTYTETSGTITFIADFDGVYSFYTCAIDNSNNYESAPSGYDATTIVDTTTPLIVFEILPALVTEHTFYINVTATDANGVTSVTIYYRSSDGIWTVYGTDNIAPFSWSFDTTTIGGDGLYEFYAVAYDNAGNYRILPIATTIPDATTTVDTTHPTATCNPTGVNITISTNITVTFSEPVNQTQAQNGFLISPAINGSFIWNVEGTIMTFVPNTLLSYGVQYTVTLNSSLIVDIAGNLMLNDITWTFTTESEPPIPPQETGSIEGRVVDEDGTGIPDAIVTLQGTSYTTTTDADGNYSFIDVPVDNYVILVEKSGYDGATTTANVLADQTTTVPPLTLSPNGRLPSYWWIILILIISIALPLIAMNRKKKEEEEPIDQHNPGLPPPPVIVPIQWIALTGGKKKIAEKQLLEYKRKLNKGFKSKKLTKEQCQSRVKKREIELGLRPPENR